MFGDIAKYRIIEKIGAGGMGEVYRAEDLALLRPVAIKMLSRQGQTVSGPEMRFLREARTASAINHPGIITVYEIIETADRACIVMEYVEGRSLRKLIDTGSLTSESILDLAIQASDALAEAHRHRIIHRDIKPTNVMVTDRGQVKVLDFGLAKYVRSAGPAREERATEVESLTEPGAVVGTLSYMSPEQLRDEPLDERTDIFSFGIVLYEMLTGCLPFAGANSFEVAASILKDEVRRIEHLPAGMPEGITAIALRALSKQRDRRYASFTEIKRDLELVKRSLSSPAGETETTTAQLAAEQTVEYSGVAIPARSERTVGLPTILVLPLEAMGSSDDATFIGIGLAHAIITDLARINGLAVLSKTSGAGRIDKSGRGASQLARELGATMLLEGEVVRSGQTVGVMARLTDAATGRVIWGAQYRGDASDLFSIQDAVCEGVASALEVSISKEVREQIARPATTNIAAFEFYSKGRSFLERRDVKENIDFAIQMFAEALKLDPSFALAHAGLAEAYWLKYETTGENEWVDSAIAAGDRALVLDPSQAQVHVSLGIIYHGTGKPDRAVEEFERAIKLQSTNDDAHRWLARCYMQKGEFEQAVAYFERAIEIRPGYWGNYNRLGICYYTFGHYREAAEQFRRVIRIQPDNYRGYDNLGVIHLLLGEYDDAVAMHLRAIEIYPNFGSYSNLGYAYFYLGRYEEAVQAYKSAIGLNPRGDIIYRNLGDAYLRVGRILEAKEQFRTAVELLEQPLGVNPDDAELLGRLALYDAKLGDEQGALSSIERAIELEPHNTTLMYQRAVVYALTGRAERAIEYLGQALAHGYSRSEAERDPDLEVLRERPEYKSLIKTPR